MNRLPALGYLATAAVALAAIVVTVRTVAFEPRDALDFESVQLAEAPGVDVAKAAQHLAEAVRFRTISHQDSTSNDWAEWERLDVWLEATYPAAHLAMSREIFAGHTLVYTWPGTDSTLAPVVLLAHHDVVPVTPGTEDDWAHPPFAGVIADDAVWGRGSVDDKGSLICIFEAIESLATSGFAPRRTVIVLSGHDEEAGGTGAHAVAEAWRARGLAPQFALDEGLAIVSDLPLAGRPVALVGIAEKGYATLRITAPATGGHSSAPPRETGVEVLAKAVLAVASRPFPMQFSGPAADMIRTLAPGAGFGTRVAVANTWLFEPLLIAKIAATPAGAALLHTTIAPTMLRGSPKANVLPQDATAWINYRIAPQDTTAKVMARAQTATRRLKVDLAWDGPAYDPSPVSSANSDAYRVIGALASGGGQVPVVPGLVTATTDSRYLAGVARDVYRFQPIVASLRDFEMIHGTNEHLTLDNLRRMTVFYSRLLATAASR
ncbi:MAG: M20 family peptidase [Steroidobacteraceae bacterium]|nr:M20 family peptidase [Steroidobacteraceae bacterium]